MNQTVESKHISLSVQGMTCTNCALSVEKYLEKEGMEQVRIDLGTGEVQFAMERPQKLKVLEKGIKRLGFEVVEKNDLRKGGLSKVERYFIFCLIFTLPLLLHMFVDWHWLHNPHVQLGLSLPVFLVGVWHFGRSALHSLKGGIPNMDVLIIIGVIAAFGYSFYGTLIGQAEEFLFYETAASIVTLVLMGNVMEHRAVKKTGSAVRSLMEWQETSARRVITGSNVELIPANTLELKDIVWIHEGERVPIDGKVVEGAGEFDESMLTGESRPVQKSMGDGVIGGTMLLQGDIKIEVSHIGSHTVLAQIIHLVKKAQTEKPSLQRLGDKVSAVFVPIVLGISFLTFLISWGILDIGLSRSIIHAVAVLVISCPCAMGLATPTAVVVGLGRASRHGILIKGARTLEQFAKVKRIVFDKTGTLTTGNFEIEYFETLGEDKDTIQSVIVSLEQHSNHPIAYSLVSAFSDQDPISLTHIQEEKGKGISAKDEAGNTWAIGSWRLLNELPNGHKHDVYVLKNGVCVAQLGLKDELKPGAKDMVHWFQKNGTEVVLLSGDQQQACEQVGKALKVNTILSEQLPEQKLTYIENSSQKMPTAMVGDGINDAAALARADVGISLGNATQVAMHASQVVLLNADLTSLPKLWNIGQRTMGTIKQNLFWAFFYNVLAIPFAAAGFLSPIIAAGAMAISDVVVIGNSLLLNIKRI